MINDVENVELKLTCNPCLLGWIVDLSTIDVQPVSKDGRYSCQLDRPKWKNPHGNTNLIHECHFRRQNALWHLDRKHIQINIEKTLIACVISKINKETQRRDTFWMSTLVMYMQDSRFTCPVGLKRQRGLRLYCGMQQHWAPTFLGMHTP